MASKEEYYFNSLQQYAVNTLQRHFIIQNQVVKKGSLKYNVYYKIVVDSPQPVLRMQIQVYSEKYPIAVRKRFTGIDAISRYHYLQNQLDMEITDIMSTVIQLIHRR